MGSGYLLGRTRKLRFALVIGGAVTGRRIPTSAVDLLRMGVRFVAASPELAPLRAVIRGPLLAAGAEAGTAAAGYRMEMFTHRLTEVLDTLQDPATPVVTLSPADGRLSSETDVLTIEGSLTSRDDPATAELDADPGASGGEQHDGAPTTWSAERLDEGVPA